MYERQTKVLDLTVIIIIFILGCFIGKNSIDAYDTWISFNRPALETMVIGEGLWWFLKQRLSKKQGEK